MKTLSIALFLLTISACSFMNGEVDYLKQVTSIKLTQSDRVEESFDNGETFTTGVIHVEDANKFIAENRLAKFEGRVFVDVLIGKGLTKYPLPHSVIDMYEWSGRSESNKWQFILDADKKLCWYVVQYPDWGGDKP